MSLVCKCCGYEQSDAQSIKYIKRRHPHVEEHDIPYYCGACLDNASEEEYDAMLLEMNNPAFEENKNELKQVLEKALSYDEWAGREYGEDRIDIDDTADNLASLGIVQDTTLANALLDEIENVVDKYNTTIGSFFIKQKIAELRQRYQKDI